MTLKGIFILNYLKQGQNFKKKKLKEKLTIFQLRLMSEYFDTDENNVIEIIKDNKSKQDKDDI